MDNTSQESGGKVTEWARQQTDKFFLVCGIIFFAIYAHHTASSNEMKLADFAMDAAKQLLAAFLTLITAQRFMQRKVDNGGTNGITSKPNGDGGVSGVAAGS